MASEKNCWGAGAIKVPIVSSVRESLQTVPIVLPNKTRRKSLKRLENKVTDFMKCR